MGVCKLPGECRVMPGQRMGVGAKCQGKAGECREYQGNVWQWVQNTRGMQGMKGNVWECVQSARRMQGNARGTYGSAKCNGNAGECRVMSRKHIRVGAKYKGNAGECRGIPGERTGVGAKCKVNAGE